MANDKKGVDYFSPITWSPWVPNTEPDSENEIVGFWAEDSSKYKVTCPHQIRGLLIEMQNSLHIQYDEIVALRKRLLEAETRSTL